ncbi:hypothetical protein [Prosthecobacter vanneervenii]|uniref:Uncharacterized protein n=1 Tax=Prosthecobacter vanneervenii TaxID=48466 RepID=A0A7W7Y9A9_9BACT|nr:hypothetical protein [Prosthecobacter vanneervenii]MBB5032033.1 hypothetical protein [Prosthecobacter vanneervenii]
MADPEPTPADPGRWIRFALMMLPIGTIFLGIASFGIWQWKKDRAADRSFKYAMALRKPISQEGVERHAGIIRTELAKADRDLSIPGYLESTMGAENMGYTVRRLRFGKDLSLIDAELTGKSRPREIVLALVPYKGDAARVESTALAAAEVLSVAHEITGVEVFRTLRFAFIPDNADAWKRMQEAMRDDGERLMHLLVLGGPEVAEIERISEALSTKAQGTRVLSIPATQSPADTLASARQLKALLMEAAESP